MINIRYHIVSITAVFLALGIGTALGSTFLDRYTVNVLDANIRSAETRIRETRGENQRLTGQIEKAEARDTSLIQAGGLVSLSARLTDVPVVLIVSAGVDQARVDGVRSVLAESGADLRGTLQLRSAMRFDQDVDQRVVDALLTSPSTAKATRAAVYRAVNAALLGAGQPDQTGTGTPPTTAPTVPGGTAPTTVATPPGPTPPGPLAPTLPTTTQVPAGNGALVEPDGTQPAIITGLIAADYLRFAPGPGHQAGEPILESTGYRFVFVSASGLDPDDDRAMIDLLPARSSDRALPAVVVSPSAGDPVDPSAPPVTPSAVSEVRSSQRLNGLYSTVDNVETFSGLVATVVALDQAGTNPVGHYGQGEGATSLFPPAQ